MVNGQLLFGLIYENYHKIHQFLPELQTSERKYDVDIDKYEKCIYVLIKHGISRKCYTTRKHLLKKFELIILDSNIQGMEIDLRINHLYYFDKNSITLLHTRFFTRMTIYKTENLIYYLKYDLNSDQLYVSYVEKSTGKIMILIMTTSGDELFSFPVEDKVQEMGYSGDSYHIYTESKFVKADLNKKYKYLERNLPKKMSMIEYGTKDIFITSYGIKIQSTFLFLGNVKKSNYEPIFPTGM
ncbi:hypothetical protein RF11_14654 [Thelohanellus kitauei]|uniref:Uncharacterized protein n=1 Tax=Thelohanellus kitauei TaxID=669202 RepID=A0A0C2IFB4_THEKT|nr:hypothetical protein RF11_14654 [Thelohanellus kitauei]